MILVRTIMTDFLNIEKPEHVQSFAENVVLLLQLIYSVLASLLYVHTKRY